MTKFHIENPLSKKKNMEVSSSSRNSASQGSDTGALVPGISRVAKGTLVQGELEFGGTLHFAGKIEGSVQAPRGNLELSSIGEVLGDIHCQRIDCHGEIFGNIQASGESILRSDCKVIGDIITKNLSIQNGAQINGNCKMLGEHTEMDFFSMPIDNLRKHLKTGGGGKQ